MRNSVFLSMVAFFATYYALRVAAGNNALWLAFMVFLVLRGVLQYFIDRAAQAVLTGFRAEFVNGSRNACGIRAVTGFLAFAQLAGMFAVKVSNRLCARRSRR